MRYCYLHQRAYKRVAKKRAERARQRWFESVDMSDPRAVQRALAEVMRRLISEQVNPQKAGQMLFELQTASLRLRTAREDSGHFP